MINASNKTTTTLALVAVVSALGIANAPPARASVPNPHQTSFGNSHNFSTLSRPHPSPISSHNGFGSRFGTFGRPHTRLGNLGNLHSGRHSNLGELRFLNNLFNNGNRHRQFGRHGGFYNGRTSRFGDYLIYDLFRR